MKSSSIRKKVLEVPIVPITRQNEWGLGLISVRRWWFVLALVRKWNTFARGFF